MSDCPDPSPEDSAGPSTAELGRASTLRDELEWYLGRCVPWNAEPRPDVATAAITGLRPVDEARTALERTVEGVDEADLPNGYASLFHRVLNLLDVLDRHDRWVRSFESARLPPGDALRLTGYPVTEHTTLLVSVKHLFGEYYPVVAHDVEMPRDVEGAAGEKARGFVRRAYRTANADRPSGFVPRFGPRGGRAADPTRYFDGGAGNGADPNSTGGEGDSTDSMTNGDGGLSAPEALSGVTIAETPAARSSVPELLQPRGAERHTRMVMRRVETAHALSGSVQPVAPGIYRVKTTRGSVDEPATKRTGPRNDDMGSVRVPDPDVGGDLAGSTLDRTQHIVNIEPRAGTDDSEDDAASGSAPPAAADVGDGDATGDGVGDADRSAACLCDDFHYTCVPRSMDCKHILLTKRLIHSGLLPPPSADPEPWVDGRLDELTALVERYARREREDDMGLAGAGIDTEPYFDEDDARSLFPSEIEGRVRAEWVRERLLAEVEQARRVPLETDLRALVTDIARVVAPPEEVLERFLGIELPGKPESTRA